jgi:DNA-binding MurR/RpiR family transcriptional regulator
MFSHPGWKEFQEEYKQLLSTAEDTAVDSCNTNEEWQIRRGVTVTLRQLTNYEEFIRQTLNQIEEEELQDLEDASL